MRAISFTSLRVIVTTALILAWFVVMLGAYTRLTNAGLGCPDWPGCYGHIVLPSLQTKLEAAQAQYPNSPIESRKAWTEMVHRYAAGTLALLIITIGIFTRLLRVEGHPVPWKFPLVLILLVVFQAMLGMWTVTLKLLPILVMSHLLGGMLLFASLCYFRMQISELKHTPLVWHYWIGIGIIVVACQIALGGWVSSNYAGIACIGFPQCNGEWLPALHFSKGFNLLAPVGTNYQGGVLDNEARVTIQFVHRIGALITALYVVILSLCMLVRSTAYGLRIMAFAAIGLVVLQFALGIVNVVYLLPLWAAVAHNGVAALLLAILFAMHCLSAKGVAYER